MRLIIAGSRDIEDYNAVLTALFLSPFTPSVIVSGNARGVDLLGERYAEEFGLPVDRYPVTPQEWKTIGKSAGHQRNRVMAENADALLAIWDGKSPGTKGMVEITKKKNLPVFVYNPYIQKE